jgi:hypothetical protein
MVGVTGSIPVAPTILFKALAHQTTFAQKATEQAVTTVSQRGHCNGDNT